MGILVHSRMLRAWTGEARRVRISPQSKRHKANEIKRLFERDIPQAPFGPIGLPHTTTHL